MEERASAPYDLEERAFEFARQARALVRDLPRTLANSEDARQLIRSSGSIGANYIEANESLGKKDFRMRVRIGLKEAKESIFWLRLLDMRGSQPLEQKRQSLVQEATELRRILSAILKKST